MHRIWKKSMDVPAEILLLHLLWDFSNKLKEKKKVFNVHISPLKEINNPSIWSNTLTLFMILIACKIKNCTNLISGVYGWLMLGSCWGGTEFCRITCITPCDTAKDHCQFSAGWYVCKQVGMYLILYTPWTCNSGLKTTSAAEHYSSKGMWKIPCHWTQPSSS